MKTNNQTLLVTLALLALSTLNHQLSTAFAQGTTAFTYQGHLNTVSNAANGLYDMTFAVYDANVSGNQIAGPVTNSAVAVNNGLFTVTLDFGPGVFTGTNYWVQMAVSPAGAGTFAALVPRQQLTPTPYALSAANGTPAGSVMAYMGTNAPAGWLWCNGSAVSRATYAGLFSVIGTSSGTGDGVSTFNLPDLRGMFLRGANGTRSDPYADPDASSRAGTASGGIAGNNVGSVQVDQFGSHSHNPKAAGNAFLMFGYKPGDDGSYGVLSVGGFNAGYELSTGVAGGNETRPKNVYVNYIIKY